MKYLLPKLNPIITREMRSRMRGRRAFIILTVHTLLLSLLAGIIYATVYYDEINRSYYYYNFNTVPVAAFGPTLGKATFVGTVLFLLAIFSFVAPAFGAGAIAGEKERQTYDTLLITKLRARHIVLGKLGAILTMLILFVLLSLPIQSVAFFFGGVSPVELGLATVGLLVTILVFSALGLYISSRVRTTTIAVSIAYSLIIPVVYVLPILLLFITEGPFSSYFDRITSASIELLYNYVLFFLMSINPFFAAILTGEAAADGNGYFFYTDTRVGPISSSTRLWLVSPWLVYLFFYTSLALWLIFATVRRVARVSQI